MSLGLGRLPGVTFSSTVSSRRWIRNLAGVRPGDVVTEVAGKDVGNVSELLTGVASLKPGMPAKFRVLRRDETVELNVTPGKRPKPKELQR